MSEREEEYSSIGFGSVLLRRNIVIAMIVGLSSICVWLATMWTSEQDGRREDLKNCNAEKAILQNEMMNKVELMYNEYNQFLKEQNGTDSKRDKRSN
jgi:hypothetical protein